MSISELFSSLTRAMTPRHPSQHPISGQYQSASEMAFERSFAGGLGGPMWLACIC